MPTAEKLATVASLTDKMSRMQLAVVADYRGLTVAEIADLRAKLREHGTELIVAKNTLLRLAARETGCEAIEPLLQGPTAISFSYDDPAKVAKTWNDYLRTTTKVTVRGTMLGKSLLRDNGLEAVTKMPSREKVQADLLGALVAPLAGMVGLLDAPAANLVGIIDAPANELFGTVSAVTNELTYVLQARIDQLQAEGSTA